MSDSDSLELNLKNVKLGCQQEGLTDLFQQCYLTHVTIQDSDITSDTFFHLRHCSLLESLTIDTQPIDTLKWVLPELKILSSLTLDRFEFDTESLQLIVSALPSVKSLAFIKCQNMTGDTLKLIHEHCPSVTCISLTSISIHPIENLSRFGIFFIFF